MKTFIVPSIKLLAVLTLLTGIVYPIAMTLLAQWIFPRQANGSIIRQHGKIIGSELLGQQFVSPQYFHPRPSAVDYNPLPSSGSNFSPTSRALQDSVHTATAQFILYNHLPADAVVPAEMVFTSGSGLDPHISPEAASSQIMRIAQSRHLSDAGKQQLALLVQQYTEAPQWNLFGKPRVNVLKLNLAVDRELTETGE